MTLRALFASGWPVDPPATAPLSVAGRPPWRRSLQSGLVVWLLSLFMAAPPLTGWTWENIWAGRAGDFLRLCADPLTRDLHEPILAYRIVLPLFSAALHLPPAAALSLAYLCSLAALICLHRAASLRTDSAFADLLTAAIGCSAAFRYTHYCLGIPDSLTHLTTALALFSSPALAAGCVVIGFLNDERAILALPFLALWRHGDVSRLLLHSPRTWVSLVRAAAPLAAGLSVGLLVRYALKTGWIGPGISTPAVYVQMFESVHQVRPWLESWGVWFANWLNGPVWLWVLLALPVLSPRFRPAPLPALILATAFLSVCLSTFIVADAARSIGFAFAGPLLAAAWMFQRAPESARRIALAVAALQVATPALWIYQDWQFLQFRPLPWELWLVLHS